MSGAPLNDGGPAFPQPMTASGNTVHDEIGQGGMTLRDWFAGQVLLSAIADAEQVYGDEDDGDGSVNRFDWCAHRAYLYADAMIAARRRVW